jgi:NADPH:quinone reductase-like Zn-dependent oxidoreductase
MTIPQTMLAAVCTGYGGPEKVVLAERPVPVPRDNEVLVKIVATTVNSGDARIRGFNVPRGFGLIMRLVFGILRPRKPVFGTEFAGTVVAIGKSVTRFAVGDDIVAFAGLGAAHQQYRAVAATKPIVKKPKNLSFEQAASLSFGGTTALHFLRKAGLQSGENLLVIGASGTVGSAIVQLARHMGANVTAATSAGNAELAVSLGAHEVIDYRTTDYSGQTAAFDIIADTVDASSFDACFDALKPGGRYLAIAAGLAEQFRSGRGGKRQITGVALERLEDVEMLAGLAEKGIFTPLIDSTYPLSGIAAAHARVDTGRKKGSVVVLMP